MSNNKKILIADTSVLINFIHINRIDLLAKYNGDFYITQHVIDEITSDFLEQQQILQRGLSDGILKIIDVNKPEELTLFSQLLDKGRLGAGECSAIACAIHRNYSIAIEDKIAIKEARKIDKSLEVFRTQDIIKSLIVQNDISLEEADKIKAVWEAKCKFKLKYNSFKDLVI